MTSAADKCSTCWHPRHAHNAPPTYPTCMRCDPKKPKEWAHYFKEPVQ